MRKATPRHAVVIGLDTMQGLQTARILARRNIPVVGYANSHHSYGYRTNVCERIEVTEGADELLSSLEKFGSSVDAKPVIYPCQDGKVLTVSRNRARLEAAFEIVLPDNATVEMMMDKTAFYRYALDNGFPIAPTFFVSTREQAVMAAEQVPYPAVLKPSYRTSEWTANTTAKAFRAATPHELLDHFDRGRRWTDSLIIQQWIGGEVSDLYSCNAYVGRDGEVLASFVARKLRQWPPDTGQSSLGEECRNDTVLHETLRLLEAVNYRGLAYLEMKRDPLSGNHYIVEPNVGRPTGRSAIAEAGGVELLYTMYCDAAGLPLPEARTQHYTGVKWIHLRRDTQSALVAMRRGDLTITQWLASIRGRKVYAIWSWRDPLPFFVDIWETMKAALSPHQRQRRGM